MVFASKASKSLEKKQARPIMGSKKRKEQLNSLEQQQPARKKTTLLSSAPKSLEDASAEKADPVGPKSSTRVCLKNVPASLSESQLREYIQQQLSPFSSSNNNDKGSIISVTDCKILRRKDSGASRRVAFVGFTQAEHAAQCVERLNRAYCQSARLVVELACLPNLVASSSEPLKADESKGEFIDASKKPKAVPLKQTPVSTKGNLHVDQKQEEYLTIMESKSTRRKFWANDDTMGTVHDETELAISTDDEADNDGEGDDDSTLSPLHAADGAADGDDEVDPLQSKPLATASTATSNQSDMDFLRSKQVHIEDLEEASVQMNTKSARLEILAVEDVNPSDQTLHGSRMEHAETSIDVRKRLEEKPNVPLYHDKEGRGKHRNDEGERVMGEEDDLADASISQTRLFLRNLPFKATEDEILEHLQRFGDVTECHIPVDDQKRSKGYAFCTFLRPDDCQAALEALDGTDFQGRLLHVIPARETSHEQAEGNGDGTKTYKARMLSARQQAAMKSLKGWSASFVRSDAVVDTLAHRLGLNKDSILAVKDGLSSGDAAVRLALGETAVIEENRAYFAEHRVDMDALVSSSGDATQISRSKVAILVKNLPHSTTKDDLLKLFGSAGENPLRILLPPSRTIALVDFSSTNDAKGAFKRLAYRRYKDVPLYLEWAPLAHHSASSSLAQAEPNSGSLKSGPTEVDHTDDTPLLGETTTLYVKNLNFLTTEEKLWQVFSEHVDDVRAIRIPQKVAALKRSTTKNTENGGADKRSMSMGFGFVEFGSTKSLQKVLSSMQGTLVDGHAIKLSLSRNVQSSIESVPKEAESKRLNKLMVRNVPFQASRTELLKLFGSFGQLKRVRLPKKFDGSHRGFAFVEYLLHKDALTAKQTLGKTHLYGRHLVIEWATSDEDADNLEHVKKGGK